MTAWGELFRGSQGWRAPARLYRLAEAAAVVLAGAGLGLFAFMMSRFSLQIALVASAVLMLPFVAMVLGDLRKLLLTIILLELPLQVDTYLGYRQDAATFGAVGGLVISVTTICLLVLGALWLLELLSRRATVSWAGVRAALPLAALVGVHAVSVLVAYDVGLALMQVFLLAQGLMLFAVVYRMTRTPRDLLYVLALVALGVAIQGAIMMVLRARGTGFELGMGMVEARIDGGQRVGGTVGSPNSASGYLSLLLPISLVVLLAGRYGHLQEGLAGSALVLGLMGLVFTLARGGWLALVLGGGVSVLVGLRFGWIKKGRLALLGVAGGVLALAVMGTVVKRVTGNDLGSAESRVPLMELAWRIIRDHPYLGVGGNNFAVVIPRYGDPEYGGVWLYIVHNAYMLVWAETGPFGLVILVWYLLETVWRGWQSVRWRHNLLSPLALALMTGVMGHIVYMTADVFNGRSQTEMLALVAALIAAIDRMRVSEQRELVAA